MTEVSTRSEHEVRVEARKAAINNLAVKILHVRNPEIDEAVIRKDILGRKDIFSDEPLQDILGKTQTEDTSLNDYRHVLGISRFYWDSGTEIPTEVSFISKPQSEPQKEDSEGRRLVLVDQLGEDVNGDETFDFTDKDDVYVRRLSSQPRVRETGKLRMRGARNLLLGTRIERQNIELSSSLSIALLPSAIIQGEGRTPEGKGKTVIMRVRGGTVAQYEHSIIAPQTVACKDYIQLGGVITPPSPDRTQIHCEGGQFIASGGDRAGTDYLTIRDKNSGDVLIHPAQADLAPDHLPFGKLEEEVTPQDQFDADYKMEGEESRSDNGEVVRAYYIKPKDSLSFAKRARTLGWSIDHSLVNEGNVEYVITRSSQEPQD